VLFYNGQVAPWGNRYVGHTPRLISGLCPLVWTNPASREVAEARGGFERTRVIPHPQKQRKATTGLH